MNKKELIESKLVNFKSLINEHSPELNEYRTKINDYDIDELILFANNNLSSYKTFGMEYIINSFIQYLEIDVSNAVVKEKIEKYFNFLIEVLEL